MRRGGDSSRAFTLVELLVGTTLAGFALAGLLACVVFLARNFARMANSQALEEQGRRALAWLQADVARAEAVKPGSNPAAGSLTLVLPDGDVTYTYDAAGFRLRRQATFGATPDLDLLRGANCHCTSLAFTFFTGTLGAPTDQLAPAVNVPYSIKQLRLAFTLETPSTHHAPTRMRHDVVSPRMLLRQRQPPDGS